MAAVVGDVHRVDGGVGKWKEEGAELDRTDSHGSEEGSEAGFGGQAIGAVTPNPAYEALWPR